MIPRPRHSTALELECVAVPAGGDHALGLVPAAAGGGRRAERGAGGALLLLAGAPGGLPHTSKKTAERTLLLRSAVVGNPSHLEVYKYKSIFFRRLLTMRNPPKQEDMLT